MRKVSGLEAVAKDYAPKGVKVYFVYKALAHPELEGIVTPFTLEERLTHAREATKRLGNSIPFLVDAIDNPLKHALGDRNNSEFVIDPGGKIVRKRTWSDPEQLRKDLEELVGKADTFTRPEDVVLKAVAPPPAPAAKGVVAKLPRTNLSALVSVPQVEKGGRPFYAKLRAEADPALFDEGKGKLYLGFHLDPLLGAHWNNLKKPVRFTLTLPEGVKVSAGGGESPRPKADADVDPREFLLDVEAWPEGKTVTVKVSYAACTDADCHELTQVYELRRQRDRDGGRVFGDAFRARSPEDALKRLMDGDKNADGKLAKEELPSSVQGRFADFDLNKDGVLDKDEIRQAADKLGTPAAPPGETSKPVGTTRDAEKDLLEKHKQAKPRLPLPPADQRTPNAVNNGAMRAYYLPAELRDAGGGAAGSREPDPAMTLDGTFKVKLFWIASRGNNCYYCLGHQECKLRAAGVTDDDIAALDGAWADTPEKERAAFAFTKKLTHTPHLVTAADVDALKKHYTPTQVAEILVTVAGYNSTNRWTDGLNIPLEADGSRFKKPGGPEVDLSTFKTPTAGKFLKQETTVAPVKVGPRPKLESREEVEARWKEKREAVLPLADAKATAAVWGEGTPPQWAGLLATFPKAMKGRTAILKNSMDKGNLSDTLKAQIAWVAARHDRAWYALAVARDRLLRAGVKGEDVWKLDGDRKHLSEADQAALVLAETLTVAPWKVTDEMVEKCRKHFKDAEVAEIVHQSCNAAFFDRVTETARLPLEK